MLGHMGAASMKELADLRAPAQVENSLSVKRALVLFAVYLVLPYAFSFLFYVILGIYSSVATDLGHIDPSAVPEFLAPFDLPVGILSLLFTAIIVFRMTRRTLPGSISTGALASLGWRASSISSILLACCIGLAITIGYLFILLPAIPPVEGQTWGPLATAAESGGWQRFCWAVTGLLLAPLIEEFLFRGILFTGLSNAYGTYLSTAIVTILFIALHISEAMHYWPAWIAISTLAVITILLRIRTRSLLPAVAAHFSYNLALVFAVYAGNA